MQYDDKKKVYYGEIGEDKDRFVIGDESHSAKLKPHLKITKWKEENHLSVSYEIPNSIGLVEQEKAKFSGLKEEIHIYKKDNKNVEFELILKEKPKVNEWDFILSGWEDFNFFKQPATWEEFEDVVKPAKLIVVEEDVYNSYAVYHKSKRDYRIGGINYKAGKAFHIYRPKFIDADDNWIWGDLKFDNGILTVIGDKQWLQKAKYPVRIDPTFGDESDSSTGVDTSSSILASGKGQPATNGTATSIHVLCYCPVAATDIKVGLYQDDSGPAGKVGTENETENIGAFAKTWKTYNTNALSLTASQDYWCCAQGSARIDIYGDNGSGTNRYYDTHTYANAWPATHAKDSSSAFMYSIYCEYTEAAGWTGKVIGVTNPTKVLGVSNPAKVIGV